MGLPARRAQRLLDAIEARGLVTHSPERPRRYLLAAPDIAIEALILQREKELQRIRGSVGQLHERAALHRQSTPQPLIELVTQRVGAAAVPPAAGVRAAYLFGFDGTSWVEKHTFLANQGAVYFYTHDTIFTDGFDG